MKKLLLLAAVLAFAAACPKEGGGKEGGKEGGDHGAVGAKPGTYEDWCGEHAVPESQCTICHPELVAAFKATKDWCDEHGLPESHCLKCHPDLKIVRPAKKEQ